MTKCQKNISKYQVWLTCDSGSRWLLVGLKPIKAFSYGLKSSRSILFVATDYRGTTPPTATKFAC